MSFLNKKIKVSYPYPLGYPIKVVIRSFGLRALLGWLYQRYATSADEKEILISERIIELPLLHQWLGSISRESRENILEIGHVASSVSLELASLGYSVTGIDLRSYPFGHKNLTSLTGDFISHNFSDQFDFIYSLSTIEHFGFTERYDGKEKVDDRLDEKAFYKISKLLKPFGRVVISVPYARELGYSDWFRVYTRDDLIQKLEKLFNIIEQQFYKRQDNQWYRVIHHFDDPESPRDGVAIFLLSLKAE